MSVTDDLLSGKYDGNPNVEQIRTIANNRTLSPSAQAARVAEIVQGNAPSPYPSDTRATPQTPDDPPAIAWDCNILERVKEALVARGVVGEARNGQIIYLCITSRILDKQVSAAIKGDSSSGKSHLLDTTVELHPEDAVIRLSGMSPKALVHSKRDYRHRTIIVVELAALRENVEDDPTSYYIRTMLSEGRIDYEVTVRDSEGGWTTKTLCKEGPANIVFTTTETQVHAENETRLLSLTTDDSPEQTRKVLAQLAHEDNAAHDNKDWHNLQRWLAEGSANRLTPTIPFAAKLAELIGPGPVRIRRDFNALLALIRTHALLHQKNRQVNQDGRVIATVEDYAVVRDLISDVISDGLESTVPPVVRETVNVVASYEGVGGMLARGIGRELKVDKSNVSRRLKQAADRGYIRNLEEKRGKPGRWVPGDPMPDDTALLPSPDQLDATAQLPAPEPAAKPQVSDPVAPLRPEIRDEKEEVADDVDAVYAQLHENAAIDAAHEPTPDSELWDDEEARRRERSEDHQQLRQQMRPSAHNGHRKVRSIVSGRGGR